MSVLNSCSFNAIFLHPYKLQTDSRFTDYDEEIDDTLQLCFNETCQPIFRYKSGLNYEPGYTIENHFVVCEGDSLNAWYMKPNEPNGTLIYYLHGNAGNIVYQYQLITPFVERGYSVFMIDYHGFGFSEGKSTRQNVLDAAYAGFDYLLENEELLEERTILYGQSLGGHLAVVTASKYKDHIDALVTEGAFASHKDIGNDRVKVLGKIFIKEMYSAKDSIRNLNIPKLIIHSAEDKVVPYDQGEILYEAAASPKEFYQIDKPHIRGPLYYADSIVARMEELLAQ